MSRDIFFNGTSLNTISNFEVTHIFANQTPTIDLSKTRYGFSDGSAIQRHQYDNKIITVKGRTVGDREKFDIARAQLEALFYNKINKLLQYEDNQELVTYTAQLSNMQFSEPKGGFSEVTIVFETSTPFYTKGVNISVAGTVNGAVDVSLGTINGTVDALPTITILINTWSGTGSTSTQTINVTWGQNDEGICNIIGTFTAGDTIVIDVANTSVKVNGEDTLYNCNFKGLKAGVTNAIQAVCSDSAITENFTITTVYKKRYI